jgi:hypothetical protein
MHCHILLANDLLQQKAYAMIKNDPELIVQAPRNFHELTRDEHRELYVQWYLH